MVKRAALPDVISDVRAASTCRCCYRVSGEYAMLHAAAQNG
jgi:delta-aminolevulinic acid dehydratase/porphobilinogen synthase